jgi:L-threonylcarbamoyladenylate synthase
MSARFDCSDPQQRALGIEEAAAALRRGELVVLPTDTVYGVGADAFDPAAVAALLAAKGRGRQAPPPVLVGTVRAASALVQDFGSSGEDLIDQFWPGGLTLVCRASQSLVWDLGDTKGTVAIRMPLHPVALDLLKRTGPLAVSSANRSGEPPATTADEAEEQLGAAIGVYLDGGPCPGAVPSTIVDLTGTVPRLLRQGVVPIERLREVIALAVTDDEDEKIFSADERASRIIQEAFGPEGQEAITDQETPGNGGAAAAGGVADAAAAGGVGDAAAAGGVGDAAAAGGVGDAAGVGGVGDAAGADGSMNGTAGAEGAQGAEGKFAADEETSGA